jgi:hypothetical protein
LRWWLVDGRGAAVNGGSGRSLKELGSGCFVLEFLWGIDGKGSR